MLAGGQADAAVLYEVFRPPYIDEHPDAVELVTLQDFIPSYVYLLAASRRGGGSGEGGRDRGLRRPPRPLRAVGRREPRCVHPGVLRRRAEADARVRHSRRYDAQGFTEWIEPAGQAQVDQQEQADLFYAAGFLPEEVDLGPQFDPEVTNRFTTAIQEAQQ